MATPVRQIFFSFPYQSVGDVVLVIKLLEQVHRSWPEASIDVLIGETMAQLVDAIPYVRRVFMVRRSPPGSGMRVTYDQVGRIRALLKGNRELPVYDLAIAPRWTPEDSLLSAYGAFLSGAAVRCGYLGVSGDGAVANPMLTHVARGGAGEHESDRYLRLLPRCGLLPEGTADASVETEPIQTLVELAALRKRDGLAEIALPPPFFLISPGATSPLRMWPVASFAEVARSIQKEFGWLPVVLGGPSDKALCDELAARIEGARSLAGATQALQMLDLVNASELLIGNDSGPAHLSGALNKPTLVLSPFPLSCTWEHYNNPKRFHPVGEHSHVLQPVQTLPGCTGVCTSPAAHCIVQISPTQALDAVRAILP